MIRILRASKLLLDLIATSLDYFIIWNPKLNITTLYLFYKIIIADKYNPYLGERGNQLLQCKNGRMLERNNNDLKPERKI